MAAKQFPIDAPSFFGANWQECHFYAQVTCEKRDNRNPGQFMLEYVGTGDDSSYPCHYQNFELGAPSVADANSEGGENRVAVVTEVDLAGESARALVYAGMSVVSVNGTPTPSLASVTSALAASEASRCENAPTTVVKFTVPTSCPLHNNSGLIAYSRMHAPDLRTGA